MRGFSALPTVAGLLLGVFVMRPALAADIQAESGEWKFSVAPYAWAAGISGDVGLFGREPIDLDLEFSDILHDLKFAAMGVVEAHNGTVGLFGDVMYVNIDADEDIDGPELGIPVDVEAEVKTKNIAATLMGEYRILAEDATTFDLMAGIRVWHVNTDISVRVEVGGAELAQFSGDDGSTWVDPMIGFKTKINTEMPLYFTAWGMIGGAGIGSDLAWDMMGGIGYQWTTGFSTVVGYRALGVDYKSDGFVFDVVEQGAFIGGIFSF